MEKHCYICGETITARRFSLAGSHPHFVSQHPDYQAWFLSNRKYLMIFFASAIPLLVIANFLFDLQSRLLVTLLFVILVVEIVVKLQIRIRKAKRDWMEKNQAPGV